MVKPFITSQSPTLAFIANTPSIHPAIVATYGSLRGRAALPRFDGRKSHAGLITSSEVSGQTAADNDQRNAHHSSSRCTFSAPSPSLRTGYSISCPFTHTQHFPGGPFHAAPVAWLLLIDAMLIGVGLAAFLRRDLRRELLSRLPNLRCLMLMSFTSDEAMLDAILAGASGYVVKDIKGMELAKAIKEVGAGRSLLDNRAAAALMAKLRGAAEHSGPLSGLSDQERVLLDLIGEGLTNKQIAARMFLAEKTVKNYVSRLLAKLGMERRTQAAVFISKLDQSRRHPEE